MNLGFFRELEIGIIDSIFQTRQIVVCLMHFQLIISDFWADIETPWAEYSSLHFLIFEFVKKDLWLPQDCS